MLAVAASVPQLGGEAARRAAAALAMRKPAKAIDAATARTAFMGLMAGVWEPGQGWA
jgi:hypothetical protein